MTDYSIITKCLVTAKQEDIIKKGKSCVELRNERIELFDNTNLMFSKKLQKTISDYGFGVLLLGPTGKVRDVIERDKATEIIGVVKGISRLSEKEAKDLDAISSEVSNVCTTALKIPSDKKELFNDLLRQYVIAELVQQSVYGKKICIRKSGNLMDYKLNRIMRYLGINKKLEKIADFAIEYNRTEVILNDERYFTTEEATEIKGPKVNIIVRK